MTLAAGARLGPYEIVSPLGAGGMGEVYRARDTRLEREVAVKVLPERLALSTEVRQRFEREAKTISALSHPHICTLYDVGREGDTDYLVMELLAGQSLAQRLEAGPLPVQQAIEWGIQIADALEKAHTSGIVHRDLKPGNIMLTERGVKLLDFGLAKLHTAPSQQTSATVLGQLPTDPGAAPLTSEGTILGTFQYMSPEQLEGKEADAASDIFALGAVLYEMATGRKAFSGKSQASLIGSIMNAAPPPVSSLATMSPPAFDRVVATCLAKDPRDRWQTAHDVRLQLAWIAEGGSQIGLPAPVAHRRKSRERLAWGIAVALGLASALLAVGFLRRAPAAPEVVRFQVAQPAKLVVVGAPKLSPDGRYLAFNATDDAGTSRIWVRAMDAIEPRSLPGTDGASRPFWSPDSRFLGFAAGGKLRKVDVTGGPPQTICDAPTAADGTWSEDGTILFDGQTNDPIRRVPEAGGVATDLVVGGKSQVGWPQFLPGGKKFLYVEFGTGSHQGVRIASADGSDAREVVNGLSRVEYAPPGYLLFVRDTTLVAQRFDAATGKLTGEPVPVADGLGTDAIGSADFSASRSGALAYRPGLAERTQYVWFDRKGTRLEPAAEGGQVYSFDLSSDGRWLVYQQGTGDGADLWVRDIKRGVSSRFTFDAGNEGTPLVTRDNLRVIYNQSGGGRPNRIVERALDRTGPDRVLYESTDTLGAGTLTPDGQTLLLQRRTSDTPWSLWRLPIGHPEQATALVVSKFYNARPAVSPDGRWLAFESNESGRAEVYVVGMQSGAGRWQISTHGGAEPHWGPDGKELFYLSPEQRIMRVAVETGATFDAGTPAPLFPVVISQLNIRNRFAVAPDGQRFLVLTPVGEQASAPTTIVLNWQAAIAR